MIDAILARAAEGGRITPDEAVALYRDAPLEDLGRAADIVRIASVERPEEDEVEVYARVLEVYRRAVEDVAATSEALAALQELLPDRPGPDSSDR